MSNQLTEFDSSTTHKLCFLHTVGGVGSRLSFTDMTNITEEESWMWFCKRKKKNSSDNIVMCAMSLSLRLVVNMSSQGK